MPRILDYNGQEALRSTTVADIRESRSSGTQLVQVTAGTAAESKAAEAAEIPMVVCLADAVGAVREGSTRVFVTAAIDFAGAVSLDELLGVAFKALCDGADAVITARSLDAVRLLAAEGLPVMGHLGFVPKKSTQYGGIRAIGKDAEEALALWRQFQDLEAAGAFAVECELIPANIMEQIQKRTGLATISLGSGSACDVQFLFGSDICGEGQRVPRHARAYADLAALYEQIEIQRVAALSAFREDVLSGRFPSEEEVVMASMKDFAKFKAALDVEERTADRAGS